LNSQYQTVLFGTVPSPAVGLPLHDPAAALPAGNLAFHTQTLYTSEGHPVSINVLVSVGIPQDFAWGVPFGMTRGSMQPLVFNPPLAQPSVPAISVSGSLGYPGYP
jgi:hypothetical protein